MRSFFLLVCIIILVNIVRGHASDSLTGGKKSGSSSGEVRRGMVMKTPTSMLQRTARIAEYTSSVYPSGVVPTFSMEPGGRVQHRPNQNAIFTAMFYSPGQMSTSEMHRFFGSARLFFSGDIVVALETNVPKEILEVLFNYDAIIYKIPMDCIKNIHVSWMKDCKFLIDSMNYVPKAQLRYYLYQQWAVHYNRGVNIMTTDSRDVLFQSNPFLYRINEWKSADLIVFLETHPFKTIRRCFWNSRWIRECYGELGLKQIGRRVVSCSGVTMGTRDAILVYVSRSFRDRIYSFMYQCSIFSPYFYILCFFFSFRVDL